MITDATHVPKTFFDKEKLQIKGWSTIDIYNNTVLTEIDVQEVNNMNYLGILSLLENF